MAASQQLQHMALTHKHTHTRTRARFCHSQGDPWVHGPPYVPPPLGSPSHRAGRVRPEGEREGISWQWTSHAHSVAGHAHSVAGHALGCPGVLPLGRENRAGPGGRGTGVRGVAGRR